MKLSTLIFFFILYNSFIFILSLTTKIYEELSDDELKVKIFLTRQAITKLRKEIENFKAEDDKYSIENNNFLFKDESIIKKEVTQNKNKFKQINSNDQDVKMRDYHLELEDDIQKDLQLNQQLYEYFDKNPQKIKFENLKKEIKENGRKEIEDIIDLLDNHSDQIGYGTKKNFFDPIMNSDYNKDNSFNKTEVINSNVKFKQNNIKLINFNSNKPTVPTHSKNINLKNKISLFNSNGPIDFKK